MNAAKHDDRGLVVALAAHAMDFEEATAILNEMLGDDPILLRAAQLEEELAYRWPALSREKREAGLHKFLTALYGADEK